MPGVLNTYVCSSLAGFFASGTPPLQLTQCEGLLSDNVFVSAPSTPLLEADFGRRTATRTLEGTQQDTLSEAACTVSVQSH